LVVLCLLGCIFAVDVFLWVSSPPLVVDGLTDWAAHAATVILVLALIADVSRMFALGALAGGVLIDIDHVPQYLGTDFLTMGTPRPYTHSLLMVLVVVLIAWQASGQLRVFMSGAALGLASHLIRDMAEPGQNGGVSLFWPSSDRGVTIPYAVYALLMISLVLLALWRPARPAPGQREPSAGDGVPAILAPAAGIEQRPGEQTADLKAGQL
jgi:membrane-bound metal-dependent hydrolase YbcI (DUF457 family)